MNSFDKFYMIDIVPCKGVERFPKYSEYQKYSDGFSKVYSQGVNKSVVINDFSPRCALVILNNNKVVLFKSRKKIIPKNGEEILAYLLGDISDISLECIIEVEDIFENINVDVIQFLYKIREINMFKKVYH